MCTYENNSRSRESGRCSNRVRFVVFVTLDWEQTNPGKMDVKKKQNVNPVLRVIEFRRETTDIVEKTYLILITGKLC